MKYLAILLFLWISTQSYAQYTHWFPEMSQVNGRGWTSGFKDTYDRLPSSAEQNVRKEVWNLSRNSSGLHLDFKTNAKEIIVRYTVSGPLQMPHMPATGVSGVDLYIKEANGNWNWAAGKFSFGDTITFSFGQFLMEEKLYTLYLPLYNHVNWMEIKYPEAATFEVISKKENKPVVIYGTSIAQGGCASRPGLGWTNIVSRTLDREVVNMAFSGNGRLEPEVYSYLGEIDASLFILDCLPNMSGPDYIKKGILARRLDSAFTYLRNKKPETPILFTEHAGYTDEGTNTWKKETYQAANMVLKNYFSSLKKSGVANVYYLSKEDISYSIESTVDGIHPNDIGMMDYAKAYVKKIKSILLRK